ncbi:group II intron maturase-specific domain-containing protein [Nonomuraea sp. NPDC049695]|uniref:group II intron maturase-specific domain-containing protein n=1 Tax=Nonomuraea sp. NPDC049695 TaxID=3154734 RepID=UPI00343943CC
MEHLLERVDRAATLNPIIKGWAAYYRIGVSKRASAALDAPLWRLTYKWAKISHPNKPKRWIIARYFGMLNTARRDKWVFGSRATGFYLRKFPWTKIVRHRMVAGRAALDDPALTGYWTEDGHAHSDPQTGDRYRRGARKPGRTRRNTSHTHPLPPPTRRRHQPSTSAPASNLQGLLEPVAWILTQDTSGRACFTARWGSAAAAAHNV